MVKKEKNMDLNMEYTVALNSHDSSIFITGFLFQAANLEFTPQLKTFWTQPDADNFNGT